MTKPAHPTPHAASSSRVSWSARRRRDRPPDPPPLPPQPPGPAEAAAPPALTAYPVLGAPDVPAPPVSWQRTPPHPDVANRLDEDLARPVFRPRTAARRLNGLVLLASLLVTAALAREAFTARAPLEIEDLVPLGLATTLSLVLWAVRVSTPVVNLRMEGGQLVIERDGETWRCDLASTVTAVEMVGTPGRRGWKVVVARLGGKPYVIDASVVDPVQFTQVLAHYRPDVTGRA